MGSVGLFFSDLRFPPCPRSFVSSTFVPAPPPRGSRRNDKLAVLIFFPHPPFSCPWSTLRRGSVCYLTVSGPLVAPLVVKSSFVMIRAGLQRWYFFTITNPSCFWHVSLSVRHTPLLFFPPLRDSLFHCVNLFPSGKILSLAFRCIETPVHSFKRFPVTGDRNTILGFPFWASILFRASYISFPVHFAYPL